ncbi:protein spartin isoform X2 [Lucilia sericata]|nr:protein spartin isoform X2 [Lucilia sericata]
MTTDAEFLSSYERIKQANKLTLKQIDLAIEFEEKDKPLEAIAAYEESLRFIDTVFSIPVGLPDNTNGIEAEWADACTIIQKLKGAKTEVTYRLKVLKQQNSPIDSDAREVQENDDVLCEPQAKKKSTLLENPATHYDIQHVNGGPPKTYKQIAKGLREVIADKDIPVLYDTLFQAQVKLYKIQPNGVVQTMAFSKQIKHQHGLKFKKSRRNQEITGETSMSLVMCTIGGKWSYLNGMYFIQCSMKGQITDKPSTSQDEDDMIWIYPLVPTVTSCYRTDFGAFIFPDLEADVAGSAFGIILATPAELNAEQFADLQQFFLDLLEAVLAGEIEELPQPLATRPTRDTSQQVSRNIVTAADFIARGLVKGAEKTGELMMKSTPYIISKMKPAPENPPPVSQGLQTTVEVAKGVTTAAVGVTGWVAGKVGSASMAIGRFLAPHIQHHGSNLLQKTCGLDQQEANSKMEGALTLAAGAVEGFSTIVDGLEKSAAILGNNISENSVKIIEHKYGSPAGYVAADTFDTLGNAFIVSRNVNYMLPKGIAKKMVKNTGIAVFDDYKQNYKGEQYVAAGALYPDLRSLRDKAEESLALKE